MATSTPPPPLQSSVDLALAMWFLESIRLRAEREGVTPGVVAALRDGHRDLGEAIADVAAEAGVGAPQTLRKRVVELLDREVTWPTAALLLVVTVPAAWYALDGVVALASKVLS